MCGFEESDVQKELTTDSGWRAILAYRPCIFSGSWKVYIQKGDFFQLLFDTYREDMAEKAFLRAVEVSEDQDKIIHHLSQRGSVLKLYRWRDKVYMSLVQRRILGFKWYEVIWITTTCEVAFSVRFLSQRKAEKGYELWSGN